MTVAAPLALVLLAFFTYATCRLERWSNAREARLAQLRTEDAVILGHPGADEAFADQLRSWLDAGQGQAAAR